MQPINVILLEDDIHLVRAIQHTLSPDYRVLASEDVCTALKFLEGIDVALAIVDDVLPRKSGMDFIKAAKASHPNLATIMITAQPTSRHAIECVNLGVKHFLEKPFTLDQLRETLETFRPPAEIRIDDDAVLSISQERLEIQGRDIGLTPIEFKLIAKIALGKGFLVPRKDLVFHIWGNTPVADNALDTHLSSARKKLGRCADRILISRGKGYRWDFQSLE